MFLLAMSYGGGICAAFKAIPTIMAALMASFQSRRSSDSLFPFPGKCHVESFNFMLGDGLKLAVADLDPVEFLVPETNDRVSLWIADASIAKPSVAPGSVGATNSQVPFC